MTSVFLIKPSMSGLLHNAGLVIHESDGVGDRLNESPRPRPRE